MLVSAGAHAQAPMEKIRSIGQCIHKTTRATDLVSHVGRGRFVVLLLGTNAQGARVAADRVDGALAEIAPGTISFGLATYTRDTTDAQSLLRSADTALLAAEAMGGGVEFA